MSIDIASEKLTKALKASALTFEVEGKRLLDNVSLSVARGELLGIIGPNGAGKTTLLRMLSGILKPKSGSIIIEGRMMSEMTVKEVAQRIAIVPQTPGFTYGFTCLEVVMMGRYPFMGRFQIESMKDASIAIEAMRLTDTEQFAGRHVTTLSGGERQRVFLARALAQQPRVMLLDEPTSNLDISHQLKLFEIVKKLTSSGMAAIAAIHDISLASRYCDRIVILNHGGSLADGAPSAVLTAENIAAAFGVSARVHRDPITGLLAISVLGQVDHTEGSRYGQG